MTSADTLPDSADAGDRYNVPALERGLRVLSEFNRDNRTLSAPELARRFDLPRSTVFRLLSTLESLGFIERTEGGRDYRLGLAVLRLGFDYLASLELNELGKPLLTRLAEELRYPCNLVVRDGRSIVYVAKVSPSTTPFQSSITVGARLPAHATVFGRILLGDLTLPQLRVLYPENKLESFSAATPSTVQQLFDRVQADRACGYVVGEGFFEAGISTIAAPVRDHSGRITAALGLTIMSSRIEDERRDELLQRVRATADAVSGQLGHTETRVGANVVALRNERA